MFIWEKEAAFWFIVFMFLTFIIRISLRPFGIAPLISSNQCIKMVMEWSLQLSLGSSCVKIKENFSLCCPLQVRLCTAGFCGTLSRTWTQHTNCSWRRFTSAPAKTDTFPSSTPQGRCTTRGRSTAASSPTSTSNTASCYWYSYLCFIVFGLCLPRSLFNIKY